MRNRILKLDASDNVLIALTDLNQREQIAFSGNNYTLVSDIPAKHKFATEDLAIGADVIMYGVIVGRAVKPVRQGERLTTSNIQHQAASFHQQSQGYRWTMETADLPGIPQVGRPRGYSELLACGPARVL